MGMLTELLRNRSIVPHQGDLPSIFARTLVTLREKVKVPENAVIEMPERLETRP